MAMLSSPHACSEQCVVLEGVGLFTCATTPSSSPQPPAFGDVMSERLARLQPGQQPCYLWASSDSLILTHFRAL